MNSLQQVTDAVIRTREDFQQDIKLLCTAETVAIYLGVGVVTMLCYSLVIEIFNPDGTKEMHGLILLSDPKSKNYDTAGFTMV